MKEQITNNNTDRLCTEEETRELLDATVVQQVQITKQQWLNAYAKSLDEYAGGPYRVLFPPLLINSIPANLLHPFIVKHLWDHCNEMERPDILCKVIRTVFGYTRKSFASLFDISPKLIKKIEDGDYDLDEQMEFEGIQDTIVGFFLINPTDVKFDTEESTEEDVEGVRGLAEKINQITLEIFAKEYQELPDSIKQEMRKQGKVYGG